VHVKCKHAKKGGRGVAVTIHDLGARREWVVTSRPGRFVPGKETLYLFYRRLGESLGRSEWVRKISPPPGFDPQTFQLVASRHNDYGIPEVKMYFYLPTQNLLPLAICLNSFHLHALPIS
jgi:hypothetical protein